ncbi:uncharacterized protein F5Z01DRAFT_630406 [Emericellopsis atlantica]|uniref:LysM domain-containing protein n=1 Tax=Emericellopsis atlantica TaxID=2614577 RepID=A0A9P8CLW1_9HYPO|nr:uncharacterized protein F5Z01DRAFT_630406 [Emericellopsis atlantica]KAG9250036.1 hypothetical protein F5Z01DRAFT_630406 [Emericellopsis atlantica]
MPHDPDTNPDCSWWWDNDGSISCEDMPREWGISREDFLAWNPSIRTDCSNFIAGRSYCVEAPSSPPPGNPTVTSQDPGTTTAPDNGVETPQPTQPGMIGTCDRFYLVQKGDSCSIIATNNGIPLQSFVSWNPSVMSDCSGLWAEVYVCIRVLGYQSTTVKPSSTTSAGNGIATPQPTQPNMVKNCNKFYLVEQGDNCAAIASSNGISQAQFIPWNPSVQSDCSGLWANVYACVQVVGNPTSSSTRPSTTQDNGIATPLPTQPGIVKNCDGFHLVSSGESCASIGAKYGVIAARVQQWNGLTSACAGLWANAYVCVRTIGYKPTNNLQCASTGKTWGGNQPAALSSVGKWCNGDSSTDSSGAYTLAQTKTGCYNAPNGSNKILFTARNDFGAAATLPVARCEEIMRAQINGCTMGGSGTSEGWWFR